MASAVDSERKAPKQINTIIIIEHHLVSQYNGTICMQKIIVKMVSLGLYTIWFAIVEFGSPLANAGGVISTELSPIRKWIEPKLLFSCKAKICRCSYYQIE